ncbi:glycosyltransferase family 2 protein [Reichenbachiella versicolor]|uniref:glycosyltransferase family 2 protein n=1 Tax=Reichenbachiella versicolor TaxID=1821036 RepID=UPI000D6E02CE|nr:glycosyltransferase [Reichenbachiella versicolor]
MELVTVCITTFNRESLIRPAVENILKQTYQNFELIIVNDCSVDGTKQELDEISDLDERIRVFHHEFNKGLSASRNTAIDNANGKYYTFVDDDDAWDEDYLKKFMNFVSDFDDTYCFCCGTIIEDDLGRTMHVSSELNGTLKEIIAKGYAPPVAGQFYHTEMLKSINGYNEQVRSGVDHDLWIRLAKKGIYISSLKDCLSLPNNDQSQDRITTNYQKRLNGIKSSLEIWKEDLVMMYSDEFFERFKSAYMLTERMRFFRQFLFQKRFFKALTIYFEVFRKTKVRSQISMLIVFGLHLVNWKFKGKQVYAVKKPSLKL